MGKINARSFAVTAVVYCFGNAYILGSNSHAGRDDWLCMLLTCCITIPVVILLASLSEQYPGQDLFTILKKTLGNAAGKILSFIYGIYALLVLSMSLSCFSRYVCTCILLQTPKAVMGLLLAVCAFLFAVGGPSGIGRCAGFLLPIILIVVTLTFIASLSSMHWTYILPVGQSNIWKGVYRSMGFPFVEPILLFSLLPAVPEGTKKRYWLIPYVFTFVILILNCMRNTMVLGDSLASILSFPTTHADSVVGYESLEQRLEVLTTMVPAAAGLVEVVVAAMFASHAFCAAAGTGQPKTSLFCTLAIGLAISLLAYNTDAALKYRTNSWPLISMPLQILAPVLCLLIGNARRSKKAKIFLHSLKKTMK